MLKDCNDVKVSEPPVGSSVRLLSWCMLLSMQYARFVNYLGPISSSLVLRGDTMARHAMAIGVEHCGSGREAK